MVYARPALTLAAGFFLAHSILWGDPGFGSLRKKKLSLPIRQPAVVRLANTSIAFTGSSANRTFAQIQDVLLTSLAAEMLDNEKTLVRKSTPAEAEWALGLAVTGFSVAAPRERVDNVGKSGAAYVRWTGSLRVAYQVLDRSGRAHDAGNVSYNYDKEFTTGARFGSSTFTRLSVPGLKKSAINREPHTPDDVRDILVAEVVGQIAKKLGNTSKTIDVDIATGEDHLNRAADFMENRLWSRALDEIEKTPVFPKPESEAYRQYDLGLVHEAMAYDAKVFKDQKADLLAAQEYYDKALEMNRKEKYFVATVARVKDDLARYKAFEGMQKSDQKQVAQQPSAPPAAAPKTVAAPKTQVATAKSQSSAAPKPASPTSKSASSGKTLQASDVIEMFSAGVPESQIVDIIRTSPVRFDPLDKDTAIALARAKLPVTLQNELRKKVGAALLGPAKTSATGK
ncbi:MAG: hypothetical protein JWO19_4820 [Bryobacterales bacterium]|nr:hypothetical protein [Bryobacterales bacterium]